MEISNIENLSAEEKIRKCRIQLSHAEDGKPFFGHILNRFNIVKTEERPTMSVDYRGNLYYNPEFVNRITEDGDLENLKAVLLHETLHIAYDGNRRRGSRHSRIFNIAQDVIINHNVQNKENMELPEKVQENYTPDKDGSIEVPLNKEETLEVEDVEEESFESVYEKISGAIDPNKDGDQDGNVDGDSEGQISPEDLPETFDDPIYSDGDEEEGPGEGDEEEMGIPEDVDEGDIQGQDMDPEDASDHWKKVTEQAHATAKKRGQESGDVYENIQRRKSQKTNWKKYIRETVKSIIPSDFTYQKPHKKSSAIGAYMPDTKNDTGAEVIVTVDTSGSMSSEALSRAVDDITGIVNSVDRTDITVVQHDSEVTNVEEYKQARPDQFEEFEVYGRGGTSHEPVFERIEEIMRERNEQNVAVISITDGYTSVPEEIPVEPSNLVWVVDNYDVGKSRLKHGKILRKVPEDSL